MSFDVERYIRSDKEKVFSWVNILPTHPLSENFIREWRDNFDYEFWNKLVIHQKLSERFIEEFNNQLNWTWIGRYQKLSPEFIDKHAEKLDWDIISWSQYLSKDIIAKYCNKVNWRLAKDFQPEAAEFIQNFRIYGKWVV